MRFLVFTLAYLVGSVLAILFVGIFPGMKVDGLAIAIWLGPISAVFPALGHMLSRSHASLHEKLDDAYTEIAATSFFVPANAAVFFMLLGWLKLIGLLGNVNPATAKVLSQGWLGPLLAASVFWWVIRAILLLASMISLAFADAADNAND